jgi:SAM-dependent methyltransferase
MPSRRVANARLLAAFSLRRGDPVGWFEKLYAAAARDGTAVPWTGFEVNPHLASWASGRDRPEAGQRALVVGCGLGDDAEFLAQLGYRVTAFDVAPTAVAGARSRFPGSAVDYLVADVRNPPAGWAGRYDLVVEAYTVQVHTGEVRAEVVRGIARSVAQGGTLLVIAHARPIDGGGGPPWPLDRREVESFATGSLRLVRIEELFDDNPPGHRWRAEFRSGRR